MIGNDAIIANDQIGKLANKNSVPVSRNAIPFEVKLIIQLCLQLEFLQQELLLLPQPLQLELLQ